jgi:DNA-binding IclR family transcriptional regulator
MVRTTPSVISAMAILELLRERAPRPLGVSEVARGLEMSKATCHLILQSLQRGHFVVQDPVEKSYTLGPALIGLGAAAGGDPQLIDVARAALPPLAARTGFTAAALKLLPNARIAIIARAESPRPFQVSVAGGQSFPLAPPFGVPFLAWAPSEETDAWLDTAGAAGIGPLSAAERRDYLEALGRARRRGYSFGIRVSGDSDAGLAELRAWLDRAAEVGLDERTPDEIRSYVAEVGRLAQLPPEHRPSEGLAVSVPLVNVSAPVFDHRARVALVVTLYGFAGEIPPERVPDLAAAARHTAHTITSRIGGGTPDAELAAEAAG